MKSGCAYVPTARLHNIVICYGNFVLHCYLAIKLYCVLATTGTAVSLQAANKLNHLYLFPCGQCNVYDCIVVFQLVAVLLTQF